MSNNLDHLKSAIFFKKSEDVNGKDEVTESNELNKIFLDPYKTYLLNCAGRRDTDYSSVDTYIKEKEAFVESIKAYIISNIKDNLFAIGSSFVDKLSGQFIYDNTIYENHYEFEFPFTTITVDNPTMVEDTYNEIINTDEGNLIMQLLPEIAVMKKLDQDGNDATVSRTMSAAFDRFYSILYRKYFESLVIKTTLFYLGNTDMIKDFYASFLDKDYVPFSNNGHNNIYSTISMTLREMMQPHLESFKDCLFTISGTASYMIMAYTEVSGSLSYEEYIRTNPFAYEIMIEKYGNKEDEDDEEGEDLDGEFDDDDKEREDA